MTNPEFSNEFDILFNNIMSNQAPGLDEYEKSVFLTKAQDEIVKSYFLPQTNKSMQGFDGNEKRQIDFSTLLKVAKYSSLTTGGGFDSRASVTTIADDILMIVNENLTVTRNNKTVVLTVVPINYEEYNRLMSKPFKRPIKYQAWRLLQNDSSNKAELIAGVGDTLVSYQIRYVKRPRAIILSDLEDGVSLDGRTTAQECELDPILHHEVLQRAVELAKAAYAGDLTSQVALGTASQTNIGIVGK